MTLKTAALLAFLGSLLLAIVDLWDFISSMINLGGGLVPLKTVILAAISAFAAVTYTIFFYMFQKRD